MSQTAENLRQGNKENRLGSCPNGTDILMGETTINTEVKKKKVMGLVSSKKKVTDTGTGNDGR